MENENEMVDETIVTDDTLNVTEEEPVIEAVSYSELTEDDYNALKAEKERLEQEKAELERKNKQLFERAKKPKEAPTQQGDFLTRDEAVLIAKGYSDEDISELRIIQAGLKAGGENKKLTDLLEHSLFKASREQRLAEEKKKKATLGASNGSPVEKPVDVSKMTKEEHMKYCGF